MNRFFTGMATGLAVAYLTAPRTGRQTRNQLTEAANRQTEALKEQWEKTSAQVTKLIEEVKAGSGLFKSEPNLFADMEAGKLDKYKSNYNNTVENTADAAKATLNKAEDALKQ